MALKRKTSFILNFILVIVLVFFVGLLKSIDFKNVDSENEINNISFATEMNMFVSTTTVFLEVVSSEKDRIKGLSDRKSLDSDSGMLFQFEKPGIRGIWMKDMNFPIDIAWLDKDFKILHIESYVKPESYPEIFKPEVEALYVLEVVSGFFDRFNINLGDILDIRNK